MSILPRASASAPTGGPVKTNLFKGDCVSPFWSLSGHSKLTKRRSADANNSRNAANSFLSGSFRSRWPRCRPRLTSPPARRTTRWLSEVCFAGGVPASFVPSVLGGGVVFELGSFAADELGLCWDASGALHPVVSVANSHKGANHFAALTIAFRRRWLRSLLLVCP